MGKFGLRRIPKNNQGETVLFFGMRLRQFRIDHLFIFPKLPSRFVNQVPIRAGADALLVNWLELTITHEDTGKQHLANVFFSLNLLAFLIHTMQHLLNKPYRLLRET